jgi:hypothetical protein
VCGVQLARSGPRFHAPDGAGAPLDCRPNGAQGSPLTTQTVRPPPPNPARRRVGRRRPR